SAGPREIHHRKFLRAAWKHGGGPRRPDLPRPGRPARPGCRAVRRRVYVTPGAGTRPIDMRYEIGKTCLLLAVTLLAATPLVARFHTKQIGYVAEHAKESMGKSVWVDGCVQSQVEPGKLFQLQ